MIIRAHEMADFFEWWHAAVGAFATAFGWLSIQLMRQETKKKALEKVQEELWTRVRDENKKFWEIHGTKIDAIAAGQKRMFEAQEKQESELVKHGQLLARMDERLKNVEGRG